MPSLDLTPYNQTQGSTSDGTKFDNMLAAVQSTINALDDANIAPGAAIALSKLASNPLGKPLALTGATAATRYVGGTTSGSPSTGTFAVGDFVIDQTGKVFICTAAGTPGTWVQVGSGGAGATTYRKTTVKQVVSSVTETDLLNGEITIAGNPGVSAVIRVTAWGDFLLNGSATPGMPQFKLKLGATTLFDTSAPATNVTTQSATRRAWNLRAEIMNLGAANSQLASMVLTLAVGGSASVAFATGEGLYMGASANGPWVAEGFTTSVVDTTAGQVLAFTVINSANSASQDTTLKGALVEIV